jgi:predicted MPP superfamily phosphohydrolase
VTAGETGGTSPAAYLIDVNRFQRQLTRRAFLGGLGLCALGGGAYVRLVEPRWLTVGRHEIKISKEGARSPLRVLHLSDLHASSTVSPGFIREAIDLGLGLRPDLICLTGDFITRGYKGFEEYAKVLRPLGHGVPAFACLGNHDGGLWAARRHGYQNTHKVRDLLTKSGVTLLHNAAKTVRVREWELTLVGLGDLWAGEMQPLLAFSGWTQTGKSATLVLSHNPDTKTALLPHPWDLLLCGHTHGGQVRLPILGTPFAPVVDKRFVEGLYRWQERWIHITRGVGNLHGVRFNCPPEVSLLTLI